MAQMHLLTGTLVDLGLSPLADRTPYVVVKTNMPGGHPVMDSTGHVVLPTTRVAVNAAGEWSVSLIDTSATDLNIEPDTLQYTLIAEGAPEGMRQSGTVKVGPFPLTSAQRIDQVDADTPAIAPSWRSAFRDEMEQVKDEVRDLSQIDTPDALVAALVPAASGSATSAALNNAIGERIAGLKYSTDAAGDTIVSSLDTHTGLVKVALMSDSTGGNPFRWPSISMTAIAARWPASHVAYQEWDHDTQAYGARQVFNTGTGFIPGTEGGLVTALSDNFNRTAADVIGTSPQTGSAWVGSAPIAAGNWSLDGSKLVRQSAAGVGIVRSDLGIAGDTTVTYTGVTMSTLPDTANREFNAWFRSEMGSVAVGLRCRLQVAASTGAVAYHLFMQDGAGSAILATGPANPIPANTASTTFNITITTVGRDVTCVVNGVTLTHTLTTEDHAKLVGTGVGIGTSAGTLVGTTIDSITATVDTEELPDRGHGFLFWNGIRAGSKLDYQTERLVAMLPADADIIVISSCHNYALTAAAPYIAEVEAFVTLAKVRAPQARVIVSSQNPEFAEGSWTQAHVDAHAERNRALRVKARDEGWGYIPAFEAFLSVPNWETALMLPDGIHPNSSVQDPVLNGNFVWRDTFLNYLEAHSLVTS